MAILILVWMLSTAVSAGSHPNYEVRLPDLFGQGESPGLYLAAIIPT
jgi:hypothetical protein